MHLICFDFHGDNQFVLILVEQFSIGKLERSVLEVYNSWKGDEYEDLENFFLQKPCPVMGNKYSIIFFDLACFCL